MQQRARRLTVSLGLIAACLALGLGWSTPALADGAAPALKPNVILPPVIIKERVPRPLAAVAISRVTTQKAIPLRAFSPVDRIEGAIKRSPF